MCQRCSRRGEEADSGPAFDTNPPPDVGGYDFPNTLYEIAFHALPFTRRCAGEFVMGHTQFNSHMFEAEHLMLEDEVESVDKSSRRHFAANIKTILNGGDQNCHAKHLEDLILNPLWRMSLSPNDDPEPIIEAADPEPLSSCTDSIPPNCAAPPTTR